MTNSERQNWPPGHESRVKAAGFAWDLVLQIAALRRAHDISQAELAERLGTQQPNVSRLENPAYDRQNLRTLRAVADALDAFVDLIYVPRDKLDTYLRRRYLPVLDDPLPSATQQLPFSEVKRFRHPLHVVPLAGRPTQVNRGRPIRAA